MLNTNLDWYGNITKEEAINEYGWGYDIADDSPVFVNTAPDNNIFIGRCYDGDWCCEIEGWEVYQDEKCWNMIGQGFGKTAEEALAEAIIECVGYDVLREEENCEDASNVITREAYVFTYGDVPMFQVFADIENVNWLMGAACEFVKKNGERYGIEWEEYRW